MKFAMLRIAPCALSNANPYSHSGQGGLADPSTNRYREERNERITYSAGDHCLRSRLISR